MGGPDYYSPRSVREAWDLGHIIAFAIFTFTVLVYLEKDYREWNWKWGLILLVLMGFGGLAIELLQSIFHRDIEWIDLRRDLEGCLVTLALFNPFKINIKTKIKTTLKTFVFLILLVELLPFSIATADELIARSQFPVLSNFETPFESDRWEATSWKEVQNEVVNSVNKSLKALLDTVKYSGVALKYFPSDWSDHQSLEFSIYNTDSNKVTLHCRIHDKQHIQNGQPYSDRFNTILKLEPGWNHFVINLETVQNAPKTRVMNLAKIKSLAFFVLDLSYPVYIYIDDVFLD